MSQTCAHFMSRGVCKVANKLCSRGDRPAPRGRSSPSSATVDIGEVRCVGVEESEMEGALLLEKKEG